LVKGLKVKEIVVEGETAFALVHYDLASPKGTPFSSDVAEFWKLKNGKLDSIAIYFDTAAFSNSMAR
jgi:ketosteroid isomerase-like protein